MNEDTKVHFTLSIGYPGASHEDYFTLEELGYDPEYDKDLDKFLENEWREWKIDFIDGGWSLEDES